MSDITYEKAVEETARRNLAAEGPGNPMPDTPTGVEHLNTALNPAPVFEPKERPVPVPVINDPGVVGAPIDIGVLNRAYREHDMERADEGGGKIDDTGGMTEDKNVAEIKEAAQTRLKEADKKARGAAKKAVGDAKASTKS